MSNAAQIESAVNWAAQRIQGLITNPITVNIQISAVTGASFLGEAGPAYDETYYSFSQIKSYLNTVSPQAYIVNYDPTPTGGLYVVPTAQAKAWGLIGESSAIDGTVTFNMSESYTFDPNNRAVPGEYDFIGVAEHELTHALGRSSGLGNLNGYELFFPIDLFRYSSSGAKTMTLGYYDYFSIDGGVTHLQTYDTDSDPADWWSNAVGDAFISSTPPDTQNGFSQADFDLIYALGYSENQATSLPVMTSSATAGAKPGVFFSYTIAATNGPSSFGVTSGLPSWLSVNQATGVISGTPPTTGIFTMTIVAANAQGAATSTLTINVSASGAAGDVFGGVVLSGNWFYSSWFGIYNNAWYPWIYRTDLGFIYVDTQGSDIYLWVENGSYGGNMGWLYTNSAVYPNVYSFSRKSWLWFNGGTNFYNYSTSSWETY